LQILKKRKKLEGQYRQGLKLQGLSDDEIERRLERIWSNDEEEPEKEEVRKDKEEAANQKKLDAATATEQNPLGVAR
jgi:hypothetical protein